MKLKLIEKRPEASDVTSFFLQSEDQNFTWKAGQYMRYKLEHSADDRGISRYFTIASAPYQKQIQLTTRINVEQGSSFKKQLQALTMGSEIEAAGPLGAFTLDDPQIHYVFIAGGIGITPFHSIILDLNHQHLPINITLLYANRTEDIVFKNELEQIAASHPEFKIQYFIGDNKITETSLQPLKTKSQTPFISNFHRSAEAFGEGDSPLFYISGPESMMASFIEMLTKMGIPEDHIKHDFFPGYSGI